MVITLGFIIKTTICVGYINTFFGHKENIHGVFLLPADAQVNNIEENEADVPDQENISPTSHPNKLSIIYY